MAFQFVDRVRMTVAAGGTGNITLGSAVLGYVSLAAAGIVDGDTFNYVIVQGSDFEFGIGTYVASGTVLQRTARLGSSTGGALNVNTSALMFVDALAKDLNKFNRDPEYFYVREERASGTNGGSIVTATWSTRILNTVVANTMPGASISASVITLPSGTFRLFSKAPAYKCDLNRTRLYDVTNGVVLAYSGLSHTASAVDNISMATLNAIIVLTGTTQLKIEHYLKGNQTSTGLGRATAITGVPEIFTEVCIERLAA